MKLFASVLNGPREYSQLKKSISDLLKEKLIDGVHVDVMDGEFVENYTLDWLNAVMIKKLRNDFPKLFIEVHLMLHFPSRYFKEFTAAGTNRVWIHVEAIDDGKALNVELKKHKKVQFAPAINPETPVSAVGGNPHAMLVMTVQPGKGGQKLIPATLQKVRQLQKKYPKCRISVDGGVDKNNVKKVAKAGATEAVCGTSIFNGNVVKNAKILKRQV